MTIDEAITRLQQLQVDLKYWKDPTKDQALNLGIEALKFRQRWEQQEGEHDFIWLPGETEDDNTPRPLLHTHKSPSKKGE